MIPAPTRYARATDLDHALRAARRARRQSDRRWAVAHPGDEAPHRAPIGRRRHLAARAPRDRGARRRAPHRPAHDLGRPDRRRSSRSRGDRRVRERHRRHPGAQPRDRSAAASCTRIRPRTCRPSSSRSERGWRCDRPRVAVRCPSRSFSSGRSRRALEPQELVTDVVVPLPGPGSGSAYASVEHPASGFALAGAAALVTS